MSNPTKNATEPQLDEEPEPEGYCKPKRSTKPVKSLTFELFNNLNCSEGSWRNSISKNMFFSILEKMEQEIRKFGQSKEEGRELVITDFDLKQYLRTTWQDCHMRDKAPEDIREKSNKLRSKLFICRYFELCEYKGRTVGRNTDVDDEAQRASALRYKKFKDSINSNPMNVEVAVEALEDIARFKERLPENALKLCLALEDKLLFRDNQIISLPLSLFGFKILSKSTIGLLLCDPGYMAILENAPPPRRIIRRGFSAGQLYSRCTNMWPSYFNRLTSILNTLSGNNPVFPQSPLPIRQLATIKRKSDQPFSEERSAVKKSRIS